MADMNKVGKRVKKYREHLGLTQEQLAVNSSLDLTFIKDVEDGIVYPPIGSMIKLSRALGQRLGTFMDDQYVADPIIVRYSERKEETANSRDGAKGHYHYYPLGKGKSDRHMEPLFIRIEEDEEKAMSTHEGEEFMVVVHGKIIVRYGKEEYILERGDSVYYNSVVSHFIGAIDGPAEILAVLYSPM
ncbi:MAG: cupin domain-containing protein [Methanomassiliicoccales archaeon]|uniref:helix-turn-helix domain-containing protein n=1 Tax=Candidatus Methanarcanum hacksteinii TaxID=2911857 RepID=UPI002704825F|nr:cupin domain-containing protein [Candidatus Methanomethylophilaceae archaeon]MCI6025523.1 cupin domain-containing protein [Methanomassiliicoccales archaeon]MDY4581040.1 cupin domain-containing protein [Candidatus Methanarcanum hacksteinii]MDD7478532.1 cupin domain-containing protein [Methanomassiliicoccales archaeon]MDO5837954.1 cupin domain-containing protein [Methanomassiliicoccales archaeon]